MSNYVAGQANRPAGNPQAVARERGLGTQDSTVSGSIRPQHTDGTFAPAAPSAQVRKREIESAYDIWLSLESSPTLRAVNELLSLTDQLYLSFLEGLLEEAERVQREMDESPDSQEDEGFQQSEYFKGLRQ